jgi:hypothetical protein
MIVVTANLGLLSFPSKGQLHQARCLRHRKRESQRLSIRLNTATCRPKSLLRIDYATGRASSRAGEIRVLDSNGSLERVIAFDETGRTL